MKDEGGTEGTMKNTHADEEGEARSKISTLKKEARMVSEGKVKGETCEEDATNAPSKRHYQVKRGRTNRKKRKTSEKRTEKRDQQTRRT